LLKRLAHGVGLLGVQGLDLVGAQVLDQSIEFDDVKCAVTIAVIVLKHLVCDRLVNVKPKEA